MTTVRESRDYCNFKVTRFNRPLAPARLRKLRAKMRLHGWIDAYPMHVRKREDGCLDIIAGHHRFAVARDLGIPVKYVVCDDDADIFEMEDGNPGWTASDFHEAHLRAGDPAHIAIENYRKRTGIPLALCASLLAGYTGQRCGKSRNGVIEISASPHAELVAAVVIACRDLGIRFASNSLFVSAVSRMLRTNEFDIEKFLRKVKAYPSLMVKHPDVAGYARMIEEVFNRGSSRRIPLVFLSDEACKARNAAFKKSY